jgi:hypothetical protein
MIMVCEAKINLISDSETKIYKKIYEFNELPEHKFEVVEEFYNEKFSKDNKYEKITVTLKHLLPNGNYDEKNSRKYVLNIYNNKFYLVFSSV